MDPAELGARVLAILARGRARRRSTQLEQSAAVIDAVLRVAAQDLALGRPARGRPGRVARKLRGMVSERHVRRILSDLRAGASDSVWSDPVTTAIEVTHDRQDQQPASS